MRMPGGWGGGWGLDGAGIGLASGEGSLPDGLEDALGRWI